VFQNRNYFSSGHSDLFYHTPFHLPIPDILCQNSRLKKLTTTICLTLAVLLGSAGVCKSADFEKGLTALRGGGFATVLREWTPLAEQGDPNVEFNLGLLYRTGAGVPQDHSTAVKWYRFAAEQGYALARSNLGRMYALGRGVIQDYIYAHMWVKLAASNGQEKGAKVRDFVEKKTTPTQIAKALKLARECVRKK